MFQGEGDTKRKAASSLKYKFLYALQQADRNVIVCPSHAIFFEDFFYKNNLDLKFVHIVQLSLFKHAHNSYVGVRILASSSSTSE